MANQKTNIDTWSVRDLEDNSELKIMIESCTEMGNSSLPGLQVCYMGRFVNFEPLAAERWAYEAQKAGTAKFLLNDSSWMPDQNQFVKVYLLAEQPMKALVEVKTRSSGIVAKEYALPF